MQSKKKLLPGIDSPVIFLYTVMGCIAFPVRTSQKEGDESGEIQRGSYIPILLKGSFSTWKRL